MFTIGTPFPATPTTGRGPPPVLSTEIGSVCASTGVQTWVNMTSVTIAERSENMM
ncbi:hypothetical protein BOSP111201_04045 [Bordetella sputigena]